MSANMSASILARCQHVLYKDGSVKGGSAGLGINYHSMKRYECYSLPPVCRPDNNHAELAAIFVAILRTPETFETTLFTDSEACIRMLRSGSPDKRFKVLVECTRWLQYRRKHAVVIRKVKAHSGNMGNDRADALAKLGRSRQSLILPDVLWEQETLRHTVIAGLICDCILVNSWEMQSY
jgi:ribonuclease HI